MINYKQSNNKSQGIGNKKGAISRSRYALDCLLSWPIVLLQERFLILGSPSLYCLSLIITLSLLKVKEKKDYY